MIFLSFVIIRMKNSIKDFEIYIYIYIYITRKGNKIVEGEINLTKR
jgi:hypothetical protein